MQKTIYEDYKYSMQDTSRIYIGCKYTFGELLEEDEVSFKFRMLVERYILPEADREDTLETHLYYLPQGSFLVKLYARMKARIKINIIEEKKGWFSSGGHVKKQYVTRQLTIEQLVKISPEEKEKQGVVIQELSVSKFVLAGIM
mgnify:CR=1 FL=1